MNDANLIYAILGSVGSLLGIILASRQIVNAMKRKWEQDRQQTKAVLDNTKALEKLNDTVAKVADQVTDHEKRMQSKGI